MKLFLLIPIGLITLVVLRKKIRRNVINQPTNEERPTDQQETATPNNQIPTDPAHPEPEQPTTSHEEQHRDERENWRRRQLRPQWAMVFITFGGVVVAAWTIGILNETLTATKIAADAAKSQAISTEKTVKLTEESLDETLKNFRLDQRAWVGPIGGGVVGVLKEGTPAIFSILIKNFGKTPALKYTNRVGLQTDPSNVKFKPRYRPELATQLKPSESVIQPNGEMRINIGSKGPISKQMIDGIRDETIHYYIFGELLYQDVFKRPHYSRFCAFVLPNLKDINSCDPYNETDDK